MSLLLPVLPIRDMVLFPGVIVPLFVGRPRSLKAIEEATLQDKKLFVVSQRDVRVDDPGPEDLYRVGTLCQVLQVVRIPDGTTKVLVEGNLRAQASDYDFQREFVSAEVDPLEYEEPYSSGTEPLRRTVLEQFERYVNLHPKIPSEVQVSLAGVEDPFLAADLVASHLLVRIQEKQALLEILDPERRLEAILKSLLRENDLLEMEHSIHDRVRQEMEKGHREYYLKEQLKAIQEELGQGEGPGEIEEYRHRISKAKMPKEVERKALHELDRFSKMPPMSAEATVVRTYIDWLADLPWQQQSKDRLDVELARTVLDEDHYGLDEVKGRILEFLSVRKLAGKEMRGHVLCFVGPPGVGKTSLARSIARSLNRRFVHMSLGGIRDEAEIRGHRRTYVGALPGRILQKIRQAGTRNPVLLLDEIDKVGSDFRGDPSAALLEVLDPEQNHAFTDHFLEVPFDLSRVMFLTTANVTHSIPRPLLDRMEVISIPGYVAEEKVHIARRHLLPKILRENGLEDLAPRITDRALEKIIGDYTREAGVRNLDRQLSRIARKLARRIVENQERKETPPARVTIGPQQLKTFLGAPKLHDTCLPQEPPVGAAVGLAWTESGGDVLLIEAVHMKGKGHVTFTGNLGEIMQESAQAALGYLRGHAEELGLGEIRWDETDLHVHVPEGAIPKDGPSAGVTLALAMLSSLLERPVRPDVALTGEITLRGAVLPVGGIREKCLAAKRQGIREVILPQANRVDVEEMAPWARKGMSFHFVSQAREVFHLGLLGPGASPADPAVEEEGK